MMKQEVDHNHRFAIGSQEDINPNLSLQTLGLGAGETQNYEDFLKEVSIVELHCTPTAEKGRDNSQTEELDKQQKRTRLAAQAHNMCERRHRNRLNARMRALQQLIPHCPERISKASLLEHAIEYIKTLQHQVQILSITGGNASSVFQTPYVMAAPGYQIMQYDETSTGSCRFGMEMPNYSIN